jgi:hypothetical protein
MRRDDKAKMAWSLKVRLHCSYKYPDLNWNVMPFCWWRVAMFLFRYILKAPFMVEANFLPRTPSYKYVI